VDVPVRQTAGNQGGDLMTYGQQWRGHHGGPRFNRKRSSYQLRRKWSDLADELESAFARRELFKALTSGGAIPEMAPGALGGSLTSALSRSPPALLEGLPSIRSIPATSRQPRCTIETHTVRRPNPLVFSLSVLITIAVTLWAFADGNPAKDIRTWISGVPTAVIGVWN
jgi:hypothetical protein